MSEKRLDRIEQSLERLTEKIDKMAELMVAVVRMEEKHIWIQQRLETQDTRLNKHSESLDDHALLISEVKNKSKFNDWFIRGLIAAMITTAAFLVRG
jgi:ABC-type maltose transport system permease subunit